MYALVPREEDVSDRPNGVCTIFSIVVLALSEEDAWSKIDSPSFHLSGPYSIIEPINRSKLEKDYKMKRITQNCIVFTALDG
mgnify:CR=1 FL=1